MDFKSLPSQYDHVAAQKRWYPFWEECGYFHAEADDPRPPFTIVIPPPNVTGALHLGHALNNTLQDILIRMKRMQGFNTLWMPGTDHAGIATQAVVERRLFEEEKKTRHDLGREGLVARIWKWKDQYEARILSQLKQMGCSCDWARTQFTFNEHNSRAVREWFFHLFKDGKIYRGKRLVNWDTYLQTAVSDDEVFHEPVKGHFWHFKYPVAAKDRRPGEPEFVTIATTRPETMLGDTAVAVHPDPAAAFDKVGAELREKLLPATAKEKAELEEQMTLLLNRRAQVLSQLEQLRDMAQRGVQLELPLTGRTIPLITDEWAKPELGSGAVKITPAHDANDYDVWQRHLEIGAINILNPNGTLNENVPDKYRGLTVKKAREAVVADMEAASLLVETEDREIDLAHSDRSKTPIEPYLADQWFVKMDELAQTAMDAVTGGRVRIAPERYAKGYLDWLSEKRDWPIGRQLWWGHRIPVWSCIVGPSTRLIQWPHVSRCIGAAKVSDGRIAWQADVEGIGVIKDPENHNFRITDRNTFYVCPADDEILEREYSPGVTVKKALEDCGFVRDNDVLDTWFSSALWPHSTLGWPDETPELKKFYPTTVLVTSRDIITLWVARMVLAGLYNVGDVPFHEVYITPKILDAYGETMSKSKGNGVDPIDIIDKFGADALRFGLAYLTTDTQDVKLPVDFECPHCGAQFAQTKKNRQLPRIECEKCGKPFSTQWAEKPDDKALPRGAVVSERFELGRNFANKLWNASRFSLINLEGYAAPGSTRLSSPKSAGGFSDADLLLEDRWLLSRLATVTQQVTDALERYRYADASRTLYDFAWNEFCSFYVEMTKARFTVGGDSVPDSGSQTMSAQIGVGDASHNSKQTAQRVLAHALDVLMRLLHPMMPFLTEEVWQLLGKVAPTRGLPAAAVPSPSPSLKGRGEAAESICIAPWPTADTKRQDATIEQQFADFQAVLGAVREIRQTQNIQQREELAFSVRCDSATAELLRPMQPYFTQMARATATDIGPNATAPDVAASRTLVGRHGPMEVHVDVSRFIDAKAESKRLEKERDNLLKQIGSIDGKLANKNFVERAPAEVVDQQRAKLDELRGQLASVEAALKKLA
jgi:valyl-tRNA synthetase